MSQYTHKALSFFGRLRPAPQVRAKASFESGDYAFDLPSLSVLATMKAANHLPAIVSVGPRAFAAAIYVDHGGADSQVLSCRDMVRFRIVTAVGEQTVDRHSATRLGQGRLEQRSILAGAAGEDSRRDQVRCRMAHKGALGPFSHPVAFSASPGIVR